MKLFRPQAFQKFKPKIRPDGTRSQLCEVDTLALRRIQKGAMHHHWKGVMCNKNPFDLALYAQLLWELKPKSIIEIGYKFGGSALWFADQAEIMNLGARLYCVDVEQREQVSDPRITFVHGDGRDLGATLTDDVIAGLPHPWLIVEDADHHYLTTMAVMDFFAARMDAGDYLVVEDGICDTFGQEEKYDGGPNRAIFEFFEEYPDTFAVDAQYCDFYGNNVTWCTNGFLRRADD
ncbi:cephalosporin hydroxylase [Parasphingopyxis algicola]|uniref:CmcI family methyltransferase n=1 Tax=Parasphingopyxis algicola TaxID=2026624 RepID=UPI0015A1848D|nr:CmcI family methyltransferase [Parasphingopyxis algicola]QLC25092.1 cephalosporin hydroxylase [Parasphingopyxis algicola]